MAGSEPFSDISGWPAHVAAPCQDAHLHQTPNELTTRPIALAGFVLLACGSRLCGGGLSLPGCRCLASRRPPLPRLRRLLTGCELLGCCHRRLPYGVGSVLEQTGQTNPSVGVVNRPSVARGSLSAPSISGRLPPWVLTGRRGDYEEKLTTGNINIMKGPPSGQGPFAFAAAGATTLVRATRY
jgi:hypothetical protein